MHVHALIALDANHDEQEAIDGRASGEIPSQYSESAQRDRGTIGAAAAARLLQP
jgi:hypothetical protein